MDRYEFIWKAIQKHGYKYDYRKSWYTGSLGKIQIRCPKHGMFTVVASEHIRRTGCRECWLESIRTSLEEARERVQEIFGDNITIPDQEIKGQTTQITATCWKHGDFPSRLNDLFNGHGCPDCYNEVRGDSTRMTQEEFVEKARQVHQDASGNPLFDYSETVYKGALNSITSRCLRCGRLVTQTAASHLAGKGCKYCNVSKLENQVGRMLAETAISFEEQKTFDWLVYKGKLYLDFYLPSFNVAIECQGGQHFRPIAHFGGKKAYDETVTRDTEKKRICEEHGIRLLYFTNELGIGEYPLGKLIYTKEELIKDIQSDGNH